MGLFGSILSTVINTASLPVAVVKDVLTLGGAITETDEPYTVMKAKEIDEDLDDLKREIKQL
jgi:hypothetical protein